MHDIMKGLTTATRRVGALALVASLAAGAGAQQAAPTAPWRAWLGCWSAGGETPLGVDAGAPVVCVVPGNSADVVQVTTLADGKVVSTQRIDASGREVPVDAKGCTGTQTGRWSADGRRVYLNATATCDGVLRRTSGILAMTRDGEWLDVQGITAGGAENVRVARYHDIGMRSTVPAEIADALRDTQMSVAGARVAAGADIGTTAVVEASRATTVGVTEAFVLERGQRFALDAHDLVALADAGVSTRLTDAMIAVSNPQTFAVRRPAPRDTVYQEVAGRRIYVMMDPYASPWGWGYSPYGYSRYGYGYDPYGYNSFGSVYGYGYPGYPGYVYGGPVVIVRGTESATPHGRMVKGRGYQPAGGTGIGTGVDRSPSRAPTRAPSGESSGSSSSGARSSGSSSSGSEQRTAKPRP